MISDPTQLQHLHNDHDESELKLDASSWSSRLSLDLLDASFELLARLHSTLLHADPAFGCRHFLHLIIIIQFTAQSCETAMDGVSADQLQSVREPVVAIHSQPDCRML